MAAARHHCSLSDYTGVKPEFGSSLQRGSKRKRPIPLLLSALTVKFCLPVKMDILDRTFGSKWVGHYIVRIELHALQDGCVTRQHLQEWVGSSKGF